MAAEKGSAFVLKVGDGATSEQFTTVGGMRATSIRINNEVVDVTDKDSSAKRELLEGAGIQSVSVSGSGVFKDSATEATIRTNVLANTIDNYEIVFEDGSKFSGAFQITSLEYTGDHNGARMYSLTLESSGTVSYT